ncbi:MAG: arylesterase [Desulfobacterales bacterium]|nr:arylesterase [Desulfobacterales bacterium]
MGHRKCLIFALMAILGLLSTACGESQTAAPTAPKTAEQTLWEGTIVAMGDSLTAGLGVAEARAYPARLQARLEADGYRYRVINAGVSGETSSGALSRLDWMLTLKPDLVILETGANDGLRGIDVELVRRNIDTIVSRLQEGGVTVVMAGMKMVQNMGADYTGTFEGIFPAVAAARNVILVPFFLEGVAGNPALNQADGIHPTAEGYAVVVDNLYPAVRTALDRLRSAPPKPSGKE